MNTSELVAKSQREAYSSKMRAQGIVDSMLKSLASARGRGRPFEMTTAKLRLAQASQRVRGEKIKIAASRNSRIRPPRR